MLKRIPIVAGLIFLLGAPLLSSAVGEKPDSSQSFDSASVRFEQNATDGDVEVVFEAIAGDKGLAKLTVVSPNGQAIIEFTGLKSSTLGMRQFRFETPEPKDVDSLKAAYPEGVYTFAGVTADGKTLHDECKLTHKLPSPTTIVRPQGDAKNVDARNLELTWKPVNDVVAYTIEIEGDVNLTAKLPKSATKFVLPNGFLQPGTKYQLGIGTISADGNVSVVEAEFKTAG